jgi:tetratricopeptide (TPR) repeat protein
MDFFSKIFRRSGKSSDSDELMKALFKMAAENDERLPAVCAENSEAILASFSSWRKIPEKIRQNQAAVQYHANGLITIATIFAEQFGHPELIEMLQGPADRNPVSQIQNRLHECQSLINQLRYEDALSCAQELLLTLLRTEGTASARYLPFAYGYMGESMFQTGKANEAVEQMAQALELCRKNKDGEGVISYLGNLYEINRYLGRASKAANSAVLMAAAMDQMGMTEKAAMYRRRADIVRAGEPLNRVVATYCGRIYELEDIPRPVSGHVQFHFERNRITLRRAACLTEKGEELGSAGRYEEALQCFRDASAIDIYDPHPHYQAGETLLYLKQYEEALEEFNNTEKLAPGWFQCRSDIWLAAQLISGAVEHSVFLKLRALDATGSSAGYLPMAQQAVSENPHFAPFYLHLGIARITVNETSQAVKALQEGLGCAEEDGIRSRILCRLAMLAGDKEASQRYLKEAAELKGDLIALASATILC